MAYTQRVAQALFNIARRGDIGLFPVETSVSFSRESFNVTSLGDYNPVYVAGPENDAEIMIRGVMTSSSGLDLLHSLLETGFGLRYIGTGDHCPYCNTVWVPGTFKCLNCGAGTDPDPRCMEYNSFGKLYAWEATVEPIDGPSKFECRLMMNPDIAREILYGFDAFDNPALPFLLLDGFPAHWLCSYCGMYVNSATNRNCPGCGGNRHPVRSRADLPPIERECIYCGKKTNHGYSCRECSGRLTTLRNAYIKGEQKWLM